ncbi:group II intron reverse transcriptase/maturase [Romboutsia sp.]|uniref:group II intron reverse transcriptase/maturase n=1 Tax=Romboutsia sp. TaxID=1965302 RepID=UPI003F3797F5
MKKWYSLIDKVYDKKNLYKSFKQVKSNKGAPGEDGETIEMFNEKLDFNIVKLHHELKTNTYIASPVKRVYIDKDDGTKRPLGIPTVRDRVVQQALRNVIEPIFEPSFHPSSFGYRPKRSCHNAIAKAEMFMNKYGLEYVVDMDLSKCFDTLNHEIILKSVNEKISDGKILKLIEQFLKCGIKEKFEIQDTEIGSPQGGVISPLLMNIYMTKFDNYMKDNKIRIVRYADDILIFARTKSDAGKYKAIAVKILEDELKLKVNEKKTHIANAYDGVSYLGFIIKKNYMIIHPKRVEKFKDKIRKLTPRNSGLNIDAVVSKINPVIRGWTNYFRIANCKFEFGKLFKWIKRRLRMKKMKEWKSPKGLHKQLRRLGYKGQFKKISMSRWRNSSSTLIHMALPNTWFDEIKLFDMSKVKVNTLYCYRCSN